MTPFSGPDFGDGNPADIRGSFARNILAQNFGQRPQNPGNKHFGADIHDPKARTSTTPKDFQKLRSKKLWAEFSFRHLFRRFSHSTNFLAPLEGL